MASTFFTQGLQRVAVNASQATGTGVTYNSARYIRSASVDDSSTAFVNTDTALNTGGAVSNEYDVDLTSATRTSQTVAHIFTVPTSQGNFTIRRICLHDDTAANVSTSSTTVTAGIDGLTISKTSSFSLTPTMNIAYS